MGLTLLWYGSSQISVVGLVMMLIGLIAAVGAAVPSRLSLQTPPCPDTQTADMPTPRVRSYHWPVGKSGELAANGLRMVNEFNQPRAQVYPTNNVPH